MGKALAETLNERIESTVGEFLSNVGRLQAEQQKQVQEFQVRNSLKFKLVLYCTGFEETAISAIDSPDFLLFDS